MYDVTVPLRVTRAEVERHAWTETRTAIEWRRPQQSSGGGLWQREALGLWAIEPFGGSLGRYSPARQFARWLDSPMPTTPGWQEMVWAYRGAGHIMEAIELPDIVHARRTGPESFEFHRSDGPAIRWSEYDVEAYVWHSTNVPRWVIMDPDPARIQHEPNSEFRRCAIEHIGWDEYLDYLEVEPIAEDPDPGNPGHVLRLYRLPASAQVWAQDVNLLVMENASLDRDGSRRTYAETVPAQITGAVEAAAWQFGVTAAEYRDIERAT